MKLLLTALFLSVASVAYMQTTFTGAMDQDWNNLSNWDNGLPSITNPATLPFGLTAEIFADTFFEGTIVINGVLLNYEDLSISGDLTINGELRNVFAGVDNFGTINNNGFLVNDQGFFGNYGILNNFGSVFSCFALWIGDEPSGGLIPICPSEEVCDGADNDFDGDTDEGCGCTNENACNFDPSAIIDDASCVLLSGCTEPSSCNYDPFALCDDGSCSQVDSCGNCPGLDGCTYQGASNYNPMASCDDGSCDFSCDPNAGYSDGFQAGVASIDITVDNDAIYDQAFADGQASGQDPNGLCVGDLSNDGTVNATDLLAFLAAFGNDCLN